MNTEQQTYSTRSSASKGAKRLKILHPDIGQDGEGRWVIKNAAIVNSPAPAKKKADKQRAKTERKKRKPTEAEAAQFAAAVEETDLDGLDMANIDFSEVVKLPQAPIDSVEMPQALHADESATIVRTGDAAELENVQRLSEEATLSFAKAIGVDHMLVGKSYGDADVIATGQQMVDKLVDEHDELPAGTYTLTNTVDDGTHIVGSVQAPDGSTHVVTLPSPFLPPSTPLPIVGSVDLNNPEGIIPRRADVVETYDDLEAMAPARSVIAQPVAFIWAFLDLNPAIERKPAIALFVKHGINIHTARTQYQAYRASGGVRKK